MRLWERARSAARLIERLRLLSPVEGARHASTRKQKVQIILQQVWVHFGRAKEARLSVTRGTGCRKSHMMRACTCRTWRTSDPRAPLLLSGPDTSGTIFTLRRWRSMQPRRTLTTFRRLNWCDPHHNISSEGTCKRHRHLPLRRKRLGSGMTLGVWHPSNRSN